MNHPYLVDMSEWRWESEKAFNALLEYEINCEMKYDRPFGLPSKYPKQGERMVDFAYRHNTSVQRMKNQWRNVEEHIKRISRTEYIQRFYAICEMLNSNIKEEEIWIRL